MITLSGTSDVVRLSLLAATTTNPLEVIFAYVDMTTTTFVPTGGGASVSTIGVTTIISAPVASTQRQVKYLSVFNADTVNTTITVQHFNGVTARTLFKVTLSTLESLVYCNDQLWSVYTATGRIKMTAGDVVGPGSATDNAVARYDATTGKLIQGSLVTIDDAGNISLPGGAGVDGVDVSALGALAVAGPGSATDNAVTRFDGTGGKTVQNSLVVIDDTGNITLPGGATFDGVDVSVLGANAVAGPASAVDNRVATYNGTTGKVIKDGGGYVPLGAVLGANFASTSTTLAEVTGLRVALPSAGSYIAQYNLYFSTAAGTTGTKFVTDFSGTTTSFRHGRIFMDGTTVSDFMGGSSTTQLSGGQQVTSNAPAGNSCYGIYTLGIVVSTAGDLEMHWATEIGGSAATVFAMSNVIVVRVA